MNIVLPTALPCEPLRPLDAEIIEATRQVKEIIVSIPAEILQRVIGQFSRLIRTCIYEDCLKSK